MARFDLIVGSFRTLRIREMLVKTISNDRDIQFLQTRRCGRESEAARLCLSSNDRLLSEGTEPSVDSVVSL